MKGATRKIIIAGGGTGGHVFPALAVAGELKRRDPGMTITFIGSDRGLESRLVPEAGYALRTLRLSGMKGAGRLGQVVAGTQAIWAVLRCGLWMLRSRPDLAIGVGGFVSGPAVLAARLLNIRTMVMEQNHFPGATNRLLARWVDRVCLPSEEARQRLGGVGSVTGNPVRDAFRSVGEAPGEQPLRVLVFGGSRGAHSINQALVQAAPRLASASWSPRIVHQTGENDVTMVRQAYAAHDAMQAEVHAFVNDMPERLANADLVICRAGATTLAELAVAGRPAILVPYPYAADDHQRHNAEAVARAGAAVVLLDNELSGSQLVAQLESLLGDPPRLQQMGHAARKLARPDATQRIADIAQTLMGGMQEDGHVS